MSATFWRFGSCSELKTGIGRRATERSVAIVNPALVNLAMVRGGAEIRLEATHHTAKRLRHLPLPRCVQKKLIGVQANIAEKTVQQVMAETIPIRAYVAFRNMFCGKMRRYWTRIENFALDSEAL